MACQDASDELFFPLSAQECCNPISECTLSPMAPPLSPMSPTLPLSPMAPPLSPMTPSLSPMAPPFSPMAATFSSMAQSIEDSSRDKPSDQFPESGSNEKLGETPAGVSTPITVDKTLKEWNGFKIVGDNLDLTIHPRNQTIQNQTKSLHYFHSYAVQDRINLSGFSNICSNIAPFSMNLHSLLPSNEDKEALVSNFAVLIARILVKHVPAFSVFSDVVPQHITHEYYAEMSAKSKVVCKCMIVCVYT